MVSDPFHNVSDDKSRSVKPKKLQDHLHNGTYPVELVKSLNNEFSAELRPSYATCPLSRCCWRSVHDSGDILGLSKILAMLLSHRVMLLKFLLYSCSVRYFS